MDINKKAAFKHNFDKSFSSFMEFILFKRVVFKEQDWTSPIYPKLRQIICIQNNRDTIDKSNDEIEDGQTKDILENYNQK